MPPPLRHFSRKPRYSGGPARHIEFGIPQIYSRTSDRFRRVSSVAVRPGEGRLTEPTAAARLSRQQRRPMV